MRNTCSICGSYAINIDEAGLLCDVHFYKVQRDELLEALVALDNYINNNLSSDYPTGVDLSSLEFRNASKAIAKATGAAA